MRDLRPAEFAEDAGFRTIRSMSGDDAFDFDGFFARLRRDPRVVRCGTTYVDVPGTVERRVACGDGLCQRGVRGRRLAGRSCCTTFRVPVERAEVRRIERALPALRAARDVGGPIDAAGGFWEEDSDGDGLVLRSRRDGRCVFLSDPREGPALCTLHEWSVATGRDHRRLKPEACCLFPLYLVENGDEVFVTAYGSAYWAELEPDDAHTVHPFACLHPPAGGLPVLAEQREELEVRVGRRRWRATLRKLRSLGHPV